MAIRATAGIITIGLALLLLSGCAAWTPTGAPSRLSVHTPLRIGDIVDTAKGRVVDFDTLVSDLSRVDVVLVGETHVSAADHLIQKRIAQALFARRPSLVLALEMIPREAQTTLDRYSRGELSQEAFLKEVQWETIWGYPFALYEPILGWAAEQRIKMIGLNAPHEVVRKVSRGGLASLDPSDRNRLAAAFDLMNWEHRKKLQEEYSAHLKGSIRDFEAFYEAQLAWEETMAETIARALEEQRNSRPVLVLIGRGHIEGRSGVPERVVKRFSHQYKTVTPAPIDTPESLNNPVLADYVWITGKEDKRPPGRLGVLVRQAQSGEGLEVISILPESPAERAGIISGDIVLAAGGRALSDIASLHQAIGESTGTLVLKIKRNSKVVDITVSLAQPAP